MIELKSVSKKFRLNKTKKSFMNFVENFFSKTEDYLALKDVSFVLKKGEVLGVIGKNGSGKSTLLKIIAGILKPTEGELNVVGDVVYLSGFYNGMNKNLSMRDNIYIIGTLNGLSKKEISERIDDISKFSELSEFIDASLFQFSNGMLTRLGFSTTLFTLPKNPSILILDEALGGGLDESFQEKALSKINDYINTAEIVLVASHNLNYILNKCSKVLWIENGEVKKEGETKDVVMEYRKFTQ